MKAGRTSLVLAASNKHWDTVAKLLDAGATNLDATDGVSFLITLEAIAIYHVH